METRPTELRETTVADNGKSKIAEAKPRFDPTRIFVQKDRLVWFWFGFAMLVLVGAAVDRYVLVQSFKQRERVVVIDPANTFYVSPLLKFEEAKALHVEQSTLATPKSPLMLSFLKSAEARKLRTARRGKKSFHTRRPKVKSFRSTSISSRTRI